MRLIERQFQNRDLYIELVGDEDDVKAAMEKLFELFPGEELHSATREDIDEMKRVQNPPLDSEILVLDKQQVNSRGGGG